MGVSFGTQNRTLGVVLPYQSWNRVSGSRVTESLGQRLGRVGSGRVSMTDPRFDLLFLDLTLAYTLGLLLNVV